VSETLALVILSDPHFRLSTVGLVEIDLFSVPTQSFPGSLVIIYLSVCI